MTSRRRARRRRSQSQRGGGARWVGRLVVVLLVLGVLGTLGGYFWLQSFLRSERFREMVNTRIGEKLEADARFNQFDWDGMELRAPLFSARGEKRIRRIEMEGLETEVKLASLLAKKFETQEIRARRFEVEVDVTRAGPPLEQQSGKQSFAFSRARIDELAGMVDWGTTALKWEGMKAILTPGHARGSYEADLARGRLLTPLALFPELKLQDASLRYAGRALFLRNGDWQVYQSGRLLTDGEIDFGSGRYFFNGELSEVQCEEVLPDDWKKRLRGELSSKFTVEGAGKEPPVVAGKLGLERGHLTALPVLDRIAAYTSTERFRRLGLRVARLDYRQAGDRLELTNIVIASEGLLRIEGKLVIEADQLDGDIRLGLTPTTLARIPGASNRVFHPGKDGMQWTPVKITGTTEFPREDLSERLVAAGFEWMYEMVDGELVLKQSGRVAGDLAKGLWGATGEAAKIGAEILEQGTDLLKNGRLPNPVDPIRDGVGAVLDGILGTPQPREDDSAPHEKTLEEPNGQERERLEKEREAEEPD